MLSNLESVLYWDSNRLHIMIFILRGHPPHRYNWIDGCDLFIVVAAVVSRLIARVEESQLPPKFNARWS